MNTVGLKRCEIGMDGYFNFSMQPALHTRLRILKYTQYAIELTTAHMRKTYLTMDLRRHVNLYMYHQASTIYWFLNLLQLHRWIIVSGASE